MEFLILYCLFGNSTTYNFCSFFINSAVSRLKPFRCKIYLMECRCQQQNVETNFFIMAFTLVLKHKINIPILYLSEHINVNKKEYHDFLNISLY